MNARALVVGTALAVGFAGCGLTAVGSREDAPAPVVQPDATTANLIETSVVDTAVPPTPGTGTTQIPIGDLDAGTDADLDGDTDATVGPPPFEIVASSGGAFHAVTPGATLPCSTGGLNAATMVVRNLSASGVSLGWIDYACVEENYGVLPSNRQYSQPTYAGHRWRIRSVADGSIRVDFVIDKAGTYVVTIH